MEPQSQVYSAGTAPLQDQKPLRPFDDTRSVMLRGRRKFLFFPPFAADSLITASITCLFQHKNSMSVSLWSLLHTGPVTCCVTCCVPTETDPGLKPQGQSPNFETQNAKERHHGCKAYWPRDQSFGAELSDALCREQGATRDACSVNLVRETRIGTGFLISLCSAKFH